MIARLGDGGIDPAAVGIKTIPVWPGSLTELEGREFTQIGYGKCCDDAFGDRHQPLGMRRTETGVAETGYTDDETPFPFIRSATQNCDSGDSGSPALVTTFGRTMVAGGG